MQSSTVWRSGCKTIRAWLPTGRDERQGAVLHVAHGNRSKRKPQAAECDSLGLWSQGPGLHGVHQSFRVVPRRDSGLRLPSAAQNRASNDTPEPGGQDTAGNRCLVDFPSAGLFSSEAKPQTGNNDTAERGESQKRTRNTERFLCDLPTSAVSKKLGSSAATLPVSRQRGGASDQSSARILRAELTLEA